MLPGNAMATRKRKLLPASAKTAEEVLPEQSKEEAAKALAKRYIEDPEFRLAFESEKKNLQQDAINNLKAQAEIFGMTLVAKGDPAPRRTYTKRAGAPAGQMALLPGKSTGNSTGVSRGSANESDVIERLHKGENNGQGVAVLANDLGVDIKSLGAQLKGMVEAGKIKKGGVARGTKYFL